MMRDIKLIRSNRKTIAIEIKRDCSIIVRAPFSMSDYTIKKFIDEKNGWIEKYLKIAEQRQEDSVSFFSDDEIRALADKAMIDIPKRVSRYASLMNIAVGKVTIKNQRTRWGSCSSKGNLNFNCLLMLCPEEVRDYVVVHELCHRKELNHSVRFWQEVEKVLPDYNLQKRWLKEHGDKIIGRLKQ